jgi:hypothetical protein
MQAKHKQILLLVLALTTMTFHVISVFQGTILSVKEIKYGKEKPKIKTLWNDNLERDIISTLDSSFPILKVYPKNNRETFYFCVIGRLKETYPDGDLTRSNRKETVIEVMKHCKKECMIGAPE